jgi:hypothetical protein
MKILTNNNTPFDMNHLPEEVDDLRYCVLDYSNSQDVDYFFVPLMFLESFTTPPALLQIGPYQVQLPMDWSIVIGDKHIGDLEILEIYKLNDRPFSVFCTNPIGSFSPAFHEIAIVDVFPDVKWYFPKLKFGHILVVPLGERNQWPKSGPDCIFIVREVNKLPECLDISKIF